MTTRPDGRTASALRPIAVETRVQKFPEGSVMYRSGETAVLISASVDEGGPEWMQGTGRGWLTAEYAMHPRANPERKRRDRTKGRIDGRSTEIQRLIGRALRSAIDLSRLGERTITVDCDVLDADGGTRTASITGGMIATIMALDSLRQKGLVDAGVVREPVAAISVGLLAGEAILDLCYVEDRDAEVDLNVVGTADGAFVEVQGTAEGAPVPRAQLAAMVDLALGAIPELVAQQQAVLDEVGIDVSKLRA